MSELRRVLVIKLRHHGDVLLASPIFSTLKEIAPHCEVDALVYADTLPMLAGHSDISHIHTIDRQWKKLGLLGQTKAELGLLRRLRQRGYDLVIHLTDHWRGAWLVRILRPRLSVALLPTLHPPPAYWRRSFTHLAPLPPLGNRHTVECHLDALRAVGWKPPKELRRLIFQPSEQARKRVMALLTTQGVAKERLIHIHPASRWMFKNWSAAGFAELISSLTKEGFQPVVTSAPSEREKTFVADILSQCRQLPVDLSGQLTLEELGALIEVARLSVCVDSAPMHLAAAVGTPVVALFGPSNENEWGPWQVPHRVLTASFSCRPCRLDGCGGGKVSECLEAISAAEVLAAVHDLLEKTA
ncbi:putative lipopolysaccharide heptosyltransferase III [Sulfuricystis multivorans]|uniref:putative lipopolysaccharide heptosyltransferase III n=1 Tax=Sulfuricystis multivorans TaxID=2211108 RepID=UPI0024DFF063|nr:putative lipopolysaccharide heptosyltransferase III [Sulfuricystis multivorans]